MANGASDVELPPTRLLALTMKWLLYQYFPFTAFDDDGNIVVPRPIPDEWKAQLVAAQNVPQWEAIRDQVNLLGPEKGHCHAVGLGFLKDSIRLCIFKSIKSVKDPADGAGWVDNELASISLRNIRDLGGTRPLISDAWLYAINGVLDLLDKDDPGEPDEPPGFDAWPGAGLDEVDPATTAMFALSALKGFISMVAAIPIPRTVTATVIWFDPITSAFPRPMDPAVGGKWRDTVGPVKTWDFLTRRREVGVVWDQVGKTFYYSWGQTTGQHWGPPQFPWSMEQIRTAFYPRHLSEGVADLQQLVADATELAVDGGIDDSTLEAPEQAGVEQTEQPARLDPAQLDKLDAELLGNLMPEQVNEFAEAAAGVGADARPQDLYLSPHFQVREFHCKDGTPVPSEAITGLQRLCRNVLEPLREKFGACTVTSGYRTAAYNKRIGGASQSQHIYDLGPSSVAADCYFASGTAAQWYAQADRILGNSGGAGKYPSWVHVDNRSVRARW